MENYDNVHIIVSSVNKYTITIVYSKVATYKARCEGCGFYMIRKKRKTEDQVLHTFYAAGCEGNSVATFDKKQIQIPPCPPTGHIGCKIMQFNYFIKVCMICMSPHFILR